MLIIARTLAVLSIFFTLAGGENIESLLRERLDHVGVDFPMAYTSATTPLQNWFLPPTSTSYLRTKSSSPLPPIR